MFERLKKVLKRNCKHQGRNITVGTVVAFLLSCSVAMAFDYGTEIKFSDTTITITVDGEESNNEKLDEDVWENFTYIQNGSINKSVKFDGDKIIVDGGQPTDKNTDLFQPVYGLKIFNNSGEHITFVQNGTITSSYIDTSVKDEDGKSEIGNGLFAEIGDITTYVNGNIKGNAIVIVENEHNVDAKAAIYTSANGVIIAESSIENITGNVNGNTILTGGNGGEALADAEASANGILTSKNIQNIIGNVSGNAILTGGNNTEFNGYTYTPSDAITSASANGIYAYEVGDIAGNINGNTILIGGNSASIYASAQSLASANGIFATKIGDITGSIKGSAVLSAGNTNTNGDISIYDYAIASYSANGIYTDEIGDITGNISGFAILQRGSSPNTFFNANIIYSSANGICLLLSNSDVNNSGKVQGYISLYDNNDINVGTDEISSFYYSGNGIVVGSNYTSFKNKFKNKGLIVGSESAVALNSVGTNGAVNNYGIMAGKKILGDGQKEVNDIITDKFKNYGLQLILETKDNDKTHSLVVKEIAEADKYQSNPSEITIADDGNYTIWNAKIADGSDNKKTDSIVLDESNTYERYIFNGIDDTVSIKNSNSKTFENSVINAFQTAVNMKGGELSVTDTVLNGGADISFTYDKDAFDQNNYDPTKSNTTKPEDILIMHPSSPVIKFTENDNNFSTYGKTVINGDIKVDSNDNEITLGLHSQLNGNIIGKDTDDNTVLNLGTLGEGEANDTTLNIQDNITNIKNINIENSVTFYENISISGLDKITIKEDGVLNLRLAQSDEKENVTIENQEYINVPVAEHALDGNSKPLNIVGLGSEDSTGTLNFITNGIGKEIYVPFDNNIKVENMQFEVSSGIDKVTVGDDFIFIGAGKSLDDIVNPNIKPDVSGKRYEQLNKVYKSIYNSDATNLNELRDILSITANGENYDGSDRDEQLKNLVSYLNGIYSHSPYAFSSELSRKSVGMFRDVITDNSFIPNYEKWLVMGGFTHQDGGTTDTYYGRNYHGFDTGTGDVDADSKLTGAYVLAKYGYTDNLTLGITAGGNKGETKLDTGSKVKDNAGYIGGFVENYRHNLTLKAGAGVQYSEFDADRKTVNNNYSDKYSDTAFDIYGSMKYSLPLDNNFFLEPHATVAFTHIDQEGIDEGNKTLAIETDSKGFNYTTLKTGVDLKKVIPTEKTKHTLTAGVVYEKLLDGSDEEYITGRMKDGTDFDILVAHKNKNQISLNAKYEIERQNGILFNVKGEYSFQKVGHNNGAKYKTDGEWTVGVGIGYKF